MISFERSEKEIKEKKEPKLRQTPTGKPFSIPQLKFKIDKHRINSSAQQGKLSFIRTLVRVL